MWLEFAKVPPECVGFFTEAISIYPYIYIARPFIIRDLKNGVGPSILIDRYGVTIGQVRHAAIVAGLWKSKKK